MTPSRAWTNHRRRRTMSPLAGASRLRDIFAHVASQNFVDEGLVPDAAATRFLAELFEHSRIDANRDQLARLVAERRPADAPHGLQLLRG